MKKIQYSDALEELLDADLLEHSSMYFKARLDEHKDEVVNYQTYEIRPQHQTNEYKNEIKRFNSTEKLFEKIFGKSIKVAGTSLLSFTISLYYNFNDIEAKVPMNSVSDAISKYAPHLNNPTIISGLTFGLSALAITGIYLYSKRLGCRADLIQKHKEISIEEYSKNVLEEIINSSSHKNTQESILSFLKRKDIDIKKDQNNKINIKKRVNK